MADQVNIPDPYTADRDWQRLMESELAKTRESVLTRRIMEQDAQLSAIFTRIERGDDVELHYRDGTVIVVGARIGVSRG